MERITILGGGIAGVVAAYNLARQGKAVMLIERTPKLGGLMRSIEVGGHVYDIGAFIFDKNNAFINTFPGLRELFHEADHLNQVITINGKLDWYPFSLKGYVRERGYGSLALAAANILVSKIRDRKKEDLLQYIRYYIGSKLYEESGLRSYIERLYKTTDDTVGVEFGQQRMQSIQNDAALRRNIGMLFRRLFASRVPESDPWRCLVRPREGFDRVFGHVESVLRAEHVEVQLSRSVKLIERDTDATFRISFADGSEIVSDRIISTIPIDELARYLGRTQFDYKPEYMTLISLFYTYEGDLGFDGTYLYNFTNEGSWKRLDVFSKYYAEEPHYFAVECTSRAGDGRTMEAEREAFEEHIATLPVLKGKLRFQGGYTTRNAYPFFRKGTSVHVQKLREFAEEVGIELTGRQGKFAYISSNQVALGSLAK